MVRHSFSEETGIEGKNTLRPLPGPPLLATPNMLQQKGLEDDVQVPACHVAPLCPKQSVSVTPSVWLAAWDDSTKPIPLKDMAKMPKMWRKYRRGGGKSLN